MDANVSRSREKAKNLGRPGLGTRVPVGVAAELVWCRFSEASSGCNDGEHSLNLHLKDSLLSLLSFASHPASLLGTSTDFSLNTIPTNTLSKQPIDTGNRLPLAYYCFHNSAFPWMISLSSHPQLLLSPSHISSCAYTRPTTHWEVTRLGAHHK